MNKEQASIIPGLSRVILFMLLVGSMMAPYGCSNSPFDGLSEGKVIYDVAFEGEELNPMVKALLPSEVTTYFKGNKTCTVISMGMQMMETRLISDAENFKYTTLVSAMGKKMAMVMNKEQVEENYLDRVNLKVRHTSEVKEIAGVKCKQAIITDSTDHTYPVYYTSEIDLNQPNWSTPFRDINGLLMEYTIKFGDMIMTLKAKEIVNAKSDPGLFEIPAGYKIIEDPNELQFGL